MVILKSTVGLFKRLMPKPVRSARRALHPVSLLTPRPVRNAKRMAAKAVNPVGAIGDAAENAVVHAVRGSGKKRSSSNSSSGRAGTLGGPLIDPYPVSDDEEDGAAVEV